MAPTHDGTSSPFGQYEPGFLDTVDAFLFRIGGARWPYWVALGVLFAKLVGGAA